MTRYVNVPPYGRFPFPDDDTHTDAEIRQRVMRSEEEERVKRIARKRERRLAEKVVPVRPQGRSVIATGPTIGVIGGGEVHALIGGKIR